MLYSLLKTSEDPVTYLWAVIPMVFISVWLIIWTFNSYIEDQNHWSEKPLKMWSQFWLGLFVGGFWFNLTLIIGQSPKNFQSYVIACVLMVPGFFIALKRGVHIWKYLKS